MKSDRNENIGRKPRALSRRNVLELAGLTIGAAVFPSSSTIGLHSMGQDKSAKFPGPVMGPLSAYMSDAANHPLPEEITEKAKHHILDTLAAMISGSTLLPGKRALEFARNYSGDETCTVVASKLSRGAIEAAMTNGMLAHSDETDDSHSPSQSHPGCAVIPAALAAGEQFHINGTRFIRAVALGYDVGTRVTMTLGSQQFEAESHWSTHSIAPLFGAAAAASCAAGLKRATDAVDAGLYRAPIVGSGFLESRYRAYPKSISLWRDDGSERSHVCVVGQIRMDRC